MKDNAVKRARWALLKTPDQFTPKKREQGVVAVADQTKQVEVYAVNITPPVSQRKIQQPPAINPAINWPSSWIADAKIAANKIIEATAIRRPIKYTRNNTIDK